MKILVKTLFVSIVLASMFFAEPSFDTANKLYEAGKYSEAAAGYRELFVSGNRSAEAYFNLGNAYFKDKKLGLAILNYEKAYRIAPRDGDIKYNLDFAGSFIKENAVSDPATKFLNAFYYFLTLNELLGIVLIIFVILMALLILRIYKKSELTYWLVFGVSLLSLLLFILAVARVYENESTRVAIVIAASVEAKAAPLDNNPAAFTIPEGKKVFILNTRQDWLEVQLKAENIKGWIKKETIEMIN